MAGSVRNHGVGRTLTLRMVSQANEEGFGNCTNIGECEAVCPKGIQLENIARMNRDYLFAATTYREPQAEAAAG